MALIFVEKLPWSLQKRQKPLSLFLKAHFLSKSLQAVGYSEDWGRIIHLVFGNEHKIEIRLFPHGQNVIAEANNKRLSWLRPKELAPIKIEEGSYVPRSQEKINQEWLALRNKTVKSRNFEKEWQNERHKLEKAIVKLREAIDKREEEKAYWSTQIEDYSYMESSPIDIKKAYEGKKACDKKLEGQKQRLSELLQNIDSLTLEKFLQREANQSRKSHFQVDVDFKAKKWTTPRGITVAVGRNAKENMELLRKAKPWDLWLHLQDFPGAHGFIYRHRKQKIEEIEIHELALWVAKMSLKKKWEIMQAEKVIVVYAECRFVQPIKGDKLGRVTYKNAKSMRLSVS